MSEGKVCPNCEKKMARTNNGWLCLFCDKFIPEHGGSVFES